MKLIAWFACRVLCLRVVAAWCVLAAATLVAQQAPDRCRPPQPGPPPALNLPAIQKRQLSNGLPVWIVELHEVPVAQVNLVVFSGSADEPAGKFGVASLTAAMLEQGAGSRSALEIADAVDYLGADLGAGSGFDSSAVRLHVPVARLADALPIMADVALRPTFPKDELERLRQQRLTSILQGRDDPPTIAAVAFSRVLYGAEHRYGTPMIGHRRDDQGVHRRRSARVLRLGVPAGQRDAARRRRRHAGHGRCRCSKRASAAWKAAGAAAAPVKLPPVEQPPARAGLPRRQARRAAVADPHRLDRRAALDARLFPDRR